jgi:hypothetical protein
MKQQKLDVVLAMTPRMWFTSPVCLLHRCETSGQEWRVASLSRASEQEPSAGCN